MKIAFIAPYEELCQLVQETSKDLDIEVDSYVSSFENAVELATKLKKMEYDIIISRGVTYRLINQNVDIPVLKCYITAFDIIYAIYEASRISKNIALITHDFIDFNTELISNIFDINLIYLTSYKDSKNVKEMIKQSIDQGSEVIIGGVLSKQYAEELGYRGVLLKTAPESVREALQNAIDVINLSSRRIFQAERLKQIINFAYEGIVVVDEEGIVTHLNPKAAEILQTSYDHIIGAKVDGILPSSRLTNVLNSGEPEIGEIQNLENTTIVTNRIPIKVKGEVKGAVATFQEVKKIQDIEIKIRSKMYKKGLVSKYTFNNYIGKTRKVEQLITKSKLYAKSDSTILIFGESGTGKEILAHAIHDASERKNYPFVAVNCSAIPEHLLESELFGYDEGAFTGAKKGGKIGIFELAHKGTVFLDEIGSMPKNLQSSLLRILQEKEVWRVGANKVINVDIRVIAATNNNLPSLVKQGEFRKDLYYRLNILNLNTVPLRQKREDITVLFKYFIGKICSPQEIQITDEMKERLESYYWPGNVRELQNFVERFALLKDTASLSQIFEDFIKNSAYIEEVDEEGTPDEVSDDFITIKRGTMKDMEQEIIKKIYTQSSDNISLISQELNISRTTLWKRLKKMNLR